MNLHKTILKGCFFCVLCT